MKKLIAFVFLIAVSFTLFSQSNRTTLKSYFETGDKPTQAEFADQIDSQYNLSEDNSDSIPEGVVNLFLTTSERSEISTNTAKVTNQTHTGDVTGSVALTIEDDAVSINKLDIGGTPITGYIITAQTAAPTDWVWDVNPGDNSHYIRLTLSGANTFNQTASSLTAIPWNVETWKDNTYFSHDNVTNPERIVFDLAGTYSIQWNLSFTHIGSVNFFIAAPRYTKFGPPSTQKRGITKSFGYNTYEGTISQYSEIIVGAGNYIIVYIFIDTSSDVGSDTIINDESEIIVRKII